MSAQCGFELPRGSRGDKATLADQDDGIARVGEAAQVLLLFFGQAFLDQIIGLHA